LISNAQKELEQLAVKANIPVALTLMGLSAFPTGHPLYAGMVGMHGNYGPNMNTNECDVLIAIGMRFDDRITSNLNTYAKQAAIIHIEIDPAEVNKNVEVTVQVNADAKFALKALMPKVIQRKNNEWIKSFKKFDIEEHKRVYSNKNMGKDSDILMKEVVDEVCEITHGEAIVVTDVGQNQMIVARNYKFKKPNSWVTSGGLGTMGFGLPAAIGAKIADPEREVVLFAGDGGFQMTLQELGTVAQTGIALKMIVLNNHFLGMVRQWQEMFFKKRYSFTELSSPDFVKLADAYGIKGCKVSSRSELQQALKEQMDSKESFLIEVTVAKEDNVFPMVAPGESVSNIRLD
jgi:acetolactate synthase I/II/III large subunit